MSGRGGLKIFLKGGGGINTLCELCNIIKLGESLILEATRYIVEAVFSTLVHLVQDLLQALVLVGAAHWLVMGNIYEVFFPVAGDQVKG